MSSDKINATLDEVRSKWTLVDLLAAHDTLDMLEEAQVQANKPQKGKKRDSPP